MSNSTDSIQETNINQTDYLKLFMQESTYQDPLKPIDNREFMAQMAQFSALQETRTMNDSLRLLLSLSSANQSLMLLGKEVKIAGDNTTGIVRKIQFPPDKPPLLIIDINGSNVEKQLTEITEVW